MAKTFSIERILRSDEVTQDAESSDSQQLGTMASSHGSHHDLELMSQMAAAAYYPLGWHSVPTAEALWYNQQQAAIKELPASVHHRQQAIELRSLAAAHQQQQQQAVAAMFGAPNQAGFPFGWIPAVNPSDFAFFHGGAMPYFPTMTTHNHHHPAEQSASDRLISPWHHHHHRLHASLVPSGTSPANHVIRSGLAPAAAAATSASRKGGQIRFDVRQSHQLEETFSSTKYLTPGQRRTLANRLSLTERQVKTWFQNRRAKWRRTRKEAKEHQDGKKIEKNGRQQERQHELDETIGDECLSEDSELDSNASAHEDTRSVDDNDHVRKP